ncbi:ATP-binding cassette domain-containing protein [Arthrobacter sp. NPDC090010]|uniref:ATP-binding cassette domain-containing protein n=1 Tax=Arthrobacter sp. NPDC090010 TaxID=3363942 RepID=UPI00382B500F
MSAVPLDRRDGNTSRSDRPLSALVSHLSGEWPGMAWTAVVGLLNNLALVTLAVTGSSVVALAVVRHEVAAAGWWVTGVVAVLLRTVLTWHEMDVSHSIAYRILASLRMALFDGFSRGVPSRKRGQHTGKLAATAMGDVEKLEFFYAHTVAQLAGTVVLLGTGVGLLLATVPAVALALLAGSLALFGVTLLGFRRGTALGTAVQDARAEFSALVVDLLAGTREILGFGLQDQVQRQLAGRAAVVDAMQSRLASTMALSGSLRELCVLGTVVAVFLAAVTRGLEPVWVPGLVAGALTLLAPVAEAAATLSQLQPHRASARRVLEGIRLAPEEPASLDPVDFAPDGPLGLRVEDLEFRHDAGSAGLGPYSLAVRPGEVVGIRGRSGAGKTTLARLILRLWAPDSGTVSLEGCDGSRADIRALDEASFRRMVTLVEQDAPAFHGSVLENMRLAVPEATAEDVEAMLIRVGLPLEGARWVSGVETVLGEHGTSLSGGERARFCLARALLLKPRLLVLDETTASLDGPSEEALLDVVRGLAGDTTVLVVSHRESTLAVCERTVTLS